MEEGLVEVFAAVLGKMEVGHVHQLQDSTLSGRGEEGRRGGGEEGEEGTKVSCSTLVEFRGLRAICARFSTNFDCICSENYSLHTPAIALSSMPQMSYNIQASI